MISRIQITLQEVAQTNHIRRAQDLAPRKNGKMNKKVQFKEAVYVCYETA